MPGNSLSVLNFLSGTNPIELLRFKIMSTNSILVTQCATMAKLELDGSNLTDHESNFNTLLDSVGFVPERKLRAESELPDNHIRTLQNYLTMWRVRPVGSTPVTAVYRHLYRRIYPGHCSVSALIPSDLPRSLQCIRTYTVGSTPVTAVYRHLYRRIYPGHCSVSALIPSDLPRSLQCIRTYTVGSTPVTAVYRYLYYQ